MSSAVDATLVQASVHSANIVNRVLSRRLKVPNSKLVDVALRVLEGRGFLGAGAAGGGPEHGEALARLELALGRRAAVTVDSVVDAVIVEPSPSQDE